MKKTAIAAAVASVVGVSALSTAQANTAGLTGVWSGTYTFSMSSPGGGPVGAPSSDTWSWDFDAGIITIANTATFYGSVWTAAGVTFTDTGTSYNGNMTFSWSANPSIPVQSSWDVQNPGGAPGAITDIATVTVNSATILPTSSAFPGFQPFFAGTIHKDSGSPPAVPVPAAAWLFGSGLLGLIGVARRRRNK